MTAPQLIDIGKVIPNPHNPRIIRDEKFAKLVKSVKEFPEMGQLRPIIVNEEMQILGGNMRYRAMKEAGLKKIPVVIASISTDKQREFIIKDNVGFGEWDWSLLANEWEANDLEDWGVEVPVYSSESLEDFFNTNNEQQQSDGNKITLEYSKEDYDDVIELLSKHSGSKEAIILKLLRQ